MKITASSIAKIALCSLALCQSSLALATGQLLAVGIDRKFTYSDTTESYQWLAPGNDSVAFYDLGDPARPTLIGSVDVDNSIIGPPTNIAISPNQRIALIANAVSTVSDKDSATGFSMKPSNFISVVDLSTRPLQVVDRVNVGTMPSGISIDQSGKWAAVANRKDSSVSVLAINGTSLSVVDTIALGGTITAAAISVDGRRIFAVKNQEHSIAVLDVSASGKITDTEKDIPVGLYPWAITLSQDGNSAMVTNIGFKSASDGNPDTVSILDIAANPPRVMQHLTVGDAPEGIAMSPNGKFAAVSLLAGSFAVPKDAWFRKEVGKFSLVKFDGTQASVMSTIDVGSFPEGVAFSDDNTHMYVGNFASESLSVIKINGDGGITKVRDIVLPGPPGSIRVANQ